METNARAASPTASADTAAVLPTASLPASVATPPITTIPPVPTLPAYAKPFLNISRIEVFSCQNRPRQIWSKPTQKGTKINLKTQGTNPKFLTLMLSKREAPVFFCGKPGHHAPQCRKRVKTGNSGNPSKANLVEGDDIIAVVISQANMVTNSKNWVVDTGATRHICANKDAFTSYTPVGDDEKVVYLGDSHTAQVLGKGKVMLKLTLGKTLTLNNVLHVPNIRAKLVSVALLGKVGVKVSFEYDKIIMTKDNIFVGKGFCNQGLFVLSISKVMNENASSSAYLVDSYDIWHARLGHVSSGYIKKMQTLGLINNIDYSGLSKCQICATSKLTKKTCSSVTRETKLLELIHSDLGDLKQTMTRGGKKFYVTFIDDYSRFARIYLLRSKDETFDMFLSYKAEVENQLDRKIKKIRSDRGGEYIPLNDYCEKEGIIHEVTPPYSPESNGVVEKKK